MKDILTSLCLTDKIPKFAVEKITPDIVPKLSLLELAGLGVTECRNIMDLRIQCNVYCSSSPARKFSLNGGAPKYEIHQYILEDLLAEGFYVKEISSLLGVSERTIYRRMLDFDLKVQKFDVMTDNELDSHLLKLTSEYPNCGGGMLILMLKQQGISI